MLTRHDHIGHVVTVPLAKGSAAEGTLAIAFAGIIVARETIRK
jgi:hypothetical protein